MFRLRTSRLLFVAILIVCCVLLEYNLQIICAEEPESFWNQLTVYVKTIFGFEPPPPPWWKRRICPVVNGQTSIPNGIWLLLSTLFCAVLPVLGLVTIMAKDPIPSSPENSELVIVPLWTGGPFRQLAAKPMAIEYYKYQIPSPEMTITGPRWRGYSIDRSAQSLAIGYDNYGAFEPANLLLTNLTFMFMAPLSTRSMSYHSQMSQCRELVPVLPVYEEIHTGREAQLMWYRQLILGEVIDFFVNIVPEMIRSLANWHEDVNKLEMSMLKDGHGRLNYLGFRGAIHRLEVEFSPVEGITFEVGCKGTVRSTTASGEVRIRDLDYKRYQATYIGLKLIEEGTSIIYGCGWDR